MHTKADEMLISAECDSIEKRARIQFANTFALDAGAKSIAGKARSGGDGGQMVASALRAREASTRTSATTERV